MMKQQINVTVDGKRGAFLQGITLSEITKVERPCGGHGKCGKCKVIAKGALSDVTEAERALLSAEEIDQGVRLACLTYAMGDCEIETLLGDGGAQIVIDGALPQFELDPQFKRYGIAVDIGTTTLAARLYDGGGQRLSECSLLNPQQEWGADVVSRIEAALDGKAHLLAKAIRAALDGMVSRLCEDFGISADAIDGMVITGNTVMLSLLTGEDVKAFSHAPFDVKRLFGETVTAHTLGLLSLQADTPVYLPPCISAFVGADITCSIVASQLCKKDTAALIDVGTNGEMALWHDGRLTVSSTAAGPAFEGVSIERGMRGGAGAIDRVAVLNGALAAHVIGGGAPVGICGSGLVDAIACLLDLELLDESGYLEDGEVVIASPVRLTQRDVRMVQLAKSAICAGLLTLIEDRGLVAKDIPTLYIAGGFGNYLNVYSASRIGLLPMDLIKGASTIGNAALVGASMMLLNGAIKDQANALAKKACVLSLAESPVFSENYMDGMTLGKI